MGRVVFTFDCYGTLIDWLGGTRKKIREIYTSISDDEINEIIRYWGEADWRLVNQGYRPYREILWKGFEYALKTVGKPYDDAVIERLVNSIKEWMPFSDTRENLVKLKEVGELGIISNTDRDFILASIRNIGVEFNHVIVAEDIKIYKPDPEVFRVAWGILGIMEDDVWMHISAFPTYDVIPAKKAGVYTILLDRYKIKNTVEAQYADRIYDTFDELVEKIVEELSRKPL